LIFSWYRPGLLQTVAMGGKLNFHQQSG